MGKGDRMKRLYRSAGKGWLHGAGPLSVTNDWSVVKSLVAFHIPIYFTARKSRIFVRFF